MLNPVVNTSVERVIWDIDKRPQEICHYYWYQKYYRPIPK